MKTLDLKGPIFLLFWGPVILVFLIGGYFLLKQPPLSIKREITLPENYRKIMDSIKVFEEIKKKEKKDDIEALSFTQNPFYTPPPQPSLTVAPREGLSLKLTMILHLERKSCVINQKVYKEGDRIGNIKIKKIGDYYVDLEVPKKGRVRLEIGATYHHSG